MSRSLKIPFLLISLCWATGATGEWRVAGAERVVAMADVHGAYEAMVETLQRAEVIDEQQGWVGGGTHLVIVGDILDRGPDSRKAMDLLMRLEGEAGTSGGRVHVVIGNHESMNLIGDLRYVSKAEYAAFAPEETADERRRWLQAWAARQGGSADNEVLQKRFDENFPNGYFALRRAFAPQGRYGRWLLSKPVIVVINGTAFVHGGLSPAVESLGLDGVNGKLKTELIDYVRAQQVLIDAGVLLPTDSHYDVRPIADAFMPDIDEADAVIEAVATVRRLSSSDLFDADGPLWYRGNVACSELIEEHRLLTRLQAIGAERVVVGHTPTPTRGVLSRFDGRLIEIDTGMLKAYYKGSGNALVLGAGKLSVVNQGGGEARSPAPHPLLLGVRPDMMPVDALARLLATGEIVADRTDEVGARILDVSDGEHTVSAIFAPRTGRGIFPDVAAYRLDQLLELDMVPVTVLREVDGREGSLQFLASQHIDEAQRSASGRGADASCSLPDQWAAMYVFDALIYNTGRSQNRILYDLSSWRLMLIRHDHTLGAERGRPAYLKDVALDLHEGWRTALESLTDDVLRDEFDGLLDNRRIRALAGRRDALLAAAAERN